MKHVAIYYVIGCYAVFLAVYAIAAFSTKPTLENRGRQTASWRLVVGAVILVLIALKRGVGVSDVELWHVGPAVELAAMGLATLGLAIMLWSRYELGTNWSIAITFKQDHELIETGPYALVRHPIYSGLIVLVLSGVVLHAGVIGFVLLAAVVTGLYLKALKEEDLLTEHFPARYPEYRRRVRALVPYVL